MAEHHRIVRAWLESPSSGIIELDRNWDRRSPPRFTLGRHCPAPHALAPAPGLPAGRLYGYFFDDAGEVAFVLSLENGCGIDPAVDRVYVAGDFNGWQAAIGQAAWELLPAELEGERVMLWKGSPALLLGAGGQRFKFVTGENQWLMPPADAPNVVRDATGNVNRLLDLARTGWHLWRFSLGESLNLAESWSAGWAEGTGAPVPLVPGSFFYKLKSELPLGANVRGDETCFRIFAPRACGVTLFIAAERGEMERPSSFELAQPADAEGAAGVWQVVLDRNLHGWLYWYSIHGVLEGFDATMRVLDPYAPATVGRAGPGIVLDAAWVGQGDRSFQTPAWHDLVIAEAHLRDLVQHAPVAATAEERRGFTGLRKWVESDAFYLAQLGVNCVELQPVHEFDSMTVDEYHWGYMTNSYFAPASSYALEPEKASGVRELQQLVAALHRRGMAVVLDVVFNHVGVPDHLKFIDRLYYFEQDASGTLSNWSGCGNDLRARSAMARRLIIDSCVHFIEVYGIDGFRFDLAELLGVDVLREIEVALKRVKPDVILIAEPWSYRGHIAGALRDTGWASWNDGFRDFTRDYVRGNGGAARLEYFLRGSPWYFAKWPAQTINYTESHDDRTWIDIITERDDFNGFSPTENDRRRTHLMAALLFMSLGVPMISAGQDFLRSKHGVTNTYRRGDLNALDYRRLHRFVGTHTYFADWIAFRRGELGRLLRHWQRPSEGFFKFFHGPGGPALATVYNADLSQGADRLLFAINPTMNEFTIPLDGERIAEATGTWQMLADQDRFYLADAHGGRRPVEEPLWVSPLSCTLWVSRG
jgi:pullulanase/glycogen debranching enzyme